MADVKKMTFSHTKAGTRSRGFEMTTIDRILRQEKRLVLTKPSQVDFYNMIFITEGRGSFEIDFREYPVAKGDIILVSEEREHRFVDHEELTGIMVIFTEDFLYEILGSNTGEVLDIYKDTYLHPVMDITTGDTSILIRQLDLLKDMYDEGNVDFDLQIFALSFRAMIKMVGRKCMSLIPSKAKENKVFTTFSTLLEERGRELKSVNEYAVLMDLSSKTINLATQRAVNMSAKQYIIYKLIQKIKISLCFGDKNVDEIAREFEFSEAYNLTKFFKKHTGLTPTEFKRLNT